MGRITLNNSSILFERRDETVLIEPYGLNCIRVRSSKNARLSDEKWTLLDAKPSSRPEISGDKRRASLKNGDISVDVSTTNDWGGELVFRRRGKIILSTKNYGDYSMRYLHTEGDNYRIRYSFNANLGEHIYGLGQEQEDAFDRVGTTTELQHYNTKSVIPMYYSSLGYGFLWNNPAPGRCETTLNHIMWVADSAYQADYLVFVGDTPRDVMRTYAGLTGYSPMMRPLFFEFPQDERCYAIWDEYMYGPDILFAPIYNEGQTERQVYLPEGEWVRVGDSGGQRTEFAGWQTVNVKAEVSEYIAFVRNGAEVIKAFE